MPCLPAMRSEPKIGRCSHPSSPRAGSTTSTPSLTSPKPSRLSSTVTHKARSKTSCLGDSEGVKPKSLGDHQSAYQSAGFHLRRKAAPTRMDRGEECVTRPTGRLRLANVVSINRLRVRTYELFATLFATPPRLTICPTFQENLAWIALISTVR